MKQHLRQPGTAERSGSMNTDRLTREQVLALKPGRELDALVAGKVMGYTTHGQFREKNGVRVIIDRYSTDIAAAFDVEEKIYHMDKVGLVGRYVTELLLIVGSNGFKMVHATPEQRCKAALLAVMDGEEKHER